MTDFIETDTETLLLSSLAFLINGFPVKCLTRGWIDMDLQSIKVNKRLFFRKKSVFIVKSVVVRLSLCLIRGTRLFLLE